MLCIMYTNDAKNKLHYFLKYEVTTLELQNNVGKKKLWKKAMLFQFVKNMETCFELFEMTKMWS